MEVPLAGELFQEGEDVPQPGEADAIVEHLICTRPAQVSVADMAVRIRNCLLRIRIRIRINNLNKLFRENMKFSDLRLLFVA